MASCFANRHGDRAGDVRGSEILRIAHIHENGRSRIEANFPNNPFVESDVPTYHPVSDSDVSGIAVPDSQTFLGTR